MKPNNSGSKEFTILLLLLVAAVFFALNLNLKGCGNATVAKKEPAPTGNGTTAAKKDDKWAEGKALFKSNCAACHNLKADGTGPALAGVVARWKAAGDYKGKTGEQWLHEWVKNWNTPVSAGYPYAVDMANSRPSPMNIFTSLSDEQINQILGYIDASSATAN